MPNLSIQIGGRPFSVACEAGEEQYLKAAAQMLDVEAVQLNQASERMSEAQMLLMSGLILADKNMVLNEKISKLEEDLAQKDAEINALQSQANQPGAHSATGDIFPDQKALDKMEQLVQKVEQMSDNFEKSGNKPMP